MVRLADLENLRCPACRGWLKFRGCVQGQRLERGEVICAACQASYAVFSGVVSLYREAEVRGMDRLMRVVYDGLPSFHDPLVRFSFPFAVGESEAASRARYLCRLDLEGLAAAGKGGVARILEIGAGTGSNIPLLRSRLRPGSPVELWAVDLSLGMLRLLQQRMRFLGDRETRFLAADAHHLPFPDGFFDRVFHVGAINGYRDQRTALAEMARVARPGTPIIVVDERLDPGWTHGLRHRLFFRLMTIYDPDPHAPVEHLPPGALDVRVEQMGRFFYCLSFRMPAPVLSATPATPKAARRRALVKRTSSPGRPRSPGSARPHRPQRQRSSAG